MGAHYIQSRSTTTKTTTAKIIITGTGRAGTTFLVRLFTELGLDTGFDSDNWKKSYHDHCRAGLEHPPLALLDPAAPSIIKNPNLSTELPALLAAKSCSSLNIEHVFIPIRELEEAAKSRVLIGGQNGNIPGGLWQTNDPSQQKMVLAETFHGLVHTLTQYEIPHTFLAFPRFATDAEYTYHKISFLVPHLSEATFAEIFRRVSNPDYIHSYKEAVHADPAIAANYLNYLAEEEQNKRRHKRLKRLRRTATAIGGVLALLLGVWLGHHLTTPFI